MAERTPLPPIDEIAFQTWAKQNGIGDVNAPEGRYDYRGYWKDVASQGGNDTKQYADGLHFSDTYKQHGHPSFSVESKYSAGPHDGGRWIGEAFVPPGADLLMNSRGQSKMDPMLIRNALLAKMKGGT